MGVSINEADSTPIGFEYVPLPNMCLGEKKDFHFITNFKELPSGNYSLQLNLHRQNALGSWDRSLDQTDLIYFRIEDNKTRLQWRKDWFGVVEFSNLKIIDD